MDVKPGYKRTDVGVIPEDWEIKPAGDVCRVNQGLQIPITRRRKFPSSTARKYITIQYLNDGKKAEYIEDFSPAVCCTVNDVLMTRTGNTGIVITDVEGVFHNNFFKISYDRNLLRKEHLVNYLRQESIQRLIMTKAGTSTIPDLNHNDFYSIPIVIPPVTEQEVIAEALSDADALIVSLEKLLAKKRNLKQGTMQELLTGKRRLPGFSGEWENKRLLELGSTFGGLTGKTKHDFSHGTARYITFMNIMTNVMIDSGTFELVDVKPMEAQNRVAKGDLFFNGSSETPEEVGMCAVLMNEVQNVFLNSFCFGFRFREGASADGLYLTYYFRSREGRELLQSLAQGATRYNLSKKALLKVSFPLPKIIEQTAIATILTDMDTEIAALEEKLTKARNIKQGMMQELLTGRIRLV